MSQRESHLLRLKDLLEQIRDCRTQTRVDRGPGNGPHAPRQHDSRPGLRPENLRKHQEPHKPHAWKSAAFSSRRVKHQTARHSRSSIRDLRPAIHDSHQLSVIHYHPHYRQRRWLPHERWKQAQEWEDRSVAARRGVIRFRRPRRYLLRTNFGRRIRFDVRARLKIVRTEARLGRTVGLSNRRYATRRPVSRVFHAGPGR